MSSLTDHSIIITGASKGIGAATARHLAGLGAAVTLAARDGTAITQIAAEIETAGGKALAVPCDVSDLAAVRALIAATRERFGTVHGLVNNAGVIDPIARLGDSDPEQWAKVVDVNFKGVYYVVHAALPVMLARGGGTIINISSGAATGSLEGWSHYCATKAAVLSLTRCIDKEYRAQGIRVVGLSPGTVATDMQRQIKASGVNPVSQLDFSVHIPPEWVAQAIAYLAGPGADRHLGTDFSLKTSEGRAEVGLPGL